VVSAVDGVPECVGRDGAAELIDNLHPADFADAIIRIISEPARKASMHLAGLERAQRYNAIALARETERVFESCLV
jgi:glycosyltransferase involved in cell wall biosynthesis